MRNKFKQWLGVSLDINGRLLSQHKINKFMSQIDKLVLFFGNDIYQSSIPEISKLFKTCGEESKALEFLIIFKRAVHPMSMNKRTLHWTIDKCKEEALKYNTRKDWVNRSPGSYNAAIRNGWLDEAVKHMQVRRKKWTFEECKAEAKKYGSISQWRKSSNASYQIAYRAGWLLRVKISLKWLK